MKIKYKEMPPENRTLVLVFPGSLFRSCEEVVGYDYAFNVRQRISAALLANTGNLLVLSGRWWPEAEGYLNYQIDRKLHDAASVGKLARHYLVFEEPQMYPEWTGFGAPRGRLLFESLEGAVDDFSNLVDGSRISVIGGWLDGDDEGSPIKDVARRLSRCCPASTVEIGDETLDMSTDSDAPAHKFVS